MYVGLNSNSDRKFSYLNILKLISTLDKMVTISQTTSSNTFSWMRSFVLRFEFHWNLFLRVQLTIRPETGEFPTQRASTAENISIWWRHHNVLFRFSFGPFSHIYPLNMIKGSLLNRAPFSDMFFSYIPARICNYIHYKCGVKLLIHSQTSMVQPLKFGNG